VFFLLDSSGAMGIYWFYKDVCFFYFFFVSVYTISCWNNVSIFNFGSYSGWKVNLVGALGRSKLKILCNFQKRREKQKQKNGKTGIFTQNRFLKRSILGIGELKKNYCRYMKFPLNRSTLIAKDWKFKIRFYVSIYFCR